MGDILLRAVVVFTDEEDYRTKERTADRLEAFLAANEPPEDDWGNEPRKWVTSTPPCTNGCVTIVLAPSGSKLGWDTDDKWLAFRDKFVEFALTLPFAIVLRIRDTYESDPRWRLEG